MASFRKTFSGRGIKATVSSIDKGMGRIQNVLKSMQVDRTYVKAGLLGKKANAKRPKPRIAGAELLAGLDETTRAIVLQMAARKAKTLLNQDTPTNVELGIIHEFGVNAGGRRIPARPFIQPAFLKHRGEYLELLRLFVKKSVYTGDMRLEVALGIIGAKMAADMKLYVTSGPQIPPPNSPATLKAKLEAGQWNLDRRRSRARKAGKPVPEGPLPPPRTLVDTGRMVGSITWAVIQKSSGGG